MNASSGLMVGKVVMVTGGTGGIGKATVLGLATLGAKVVAVGRDRERAEASVAEIRTASRNPNVELMLADLSSQADVRRLAKEFMEKYDRLHALVNNAGVMSAKRQETVDGIELNLAVNHLAPFLLTHLLLPALEAGAEAGSLSRVVNVTSGAHRFGKLDLDDMLAEENYSVMGTYARAKLANVMSTYELARRMMIAGTKVTANVADPGGADTPMSRSLAQEAKDMPEVMPLWARLTAPLVMFMKTSTEDAAYSSVYLASASEVEGVSGKYYSRKGKPVKSSKASYDTAVAQKLWRLSEELTGLSRGESSMRLPEKGWAGKELPYERA